jgi:D-alanyl-D-alanine carboxypeptidase
MKPLGIKVGYLKEAKDNCAVRLSKNGKDRVIVILHSPNNARRNAEINRLMSK